MLQPYVPLCTIGALDHPNRSAELSHSPMSTGIDQRVTLGSGFCGYRLGRPSTSKFTAVVGKIRAHCSTLAAQCFWVMVWEPSEIRSWKSASLVPPAGSCCVLMGRRSLWLAFLLFWHKRRDTQHAISCLPCGGRTPPPRAHLHIMLQGCVETFDCRDSMQIWGSR